MESKRQALVVTLVALGVAISCGVALFVGVAVGNCDPSWIDDAWLPLVLLSSAGFALASGLSARYLSDSPASEGASVGIGCFVFVLAVVLLAISAFAVAWTVSCD